MVRWVSNTVHLRNAAPHRYHHRRCKEHLGADIHGVPENHTIRVVFMEHRRRLDHAHVFNLFLWGCIGASKPTFLNIDRNSSNPHKPLSTNCVPKAISQLLILPKPVAGAAFFNRGRDDSPNRHI